jgi:integrase/recombinase XerD
MKNKLVVSPDMEPSLWAMCLNAYTTLIKERGYSPASVRTHLQLLKRFSKWLSKGRNEICALDESLVKRFLLRLQSANSVRRGDAATLYRFLHVLRDQGVTRAARKSPQSPKERLITNYGRYLLEEHLLEERGVSKAAVVNYVPFVDQFLSAQFQQTPLNLYQIRASDLTDFVRRQARKLSPACAQLLVTSLRSFLRYLRHQGKITADLAACVPTVARWSFASLPKSLPVGVVQKVLDHNDRKTPLGRRDYVILLLLARLGLRACEIVALNLEDIEWENARITVRLKGGRRTQLPLPVDVGKALAQYLRYGRPSCSCRRVFIRGRAPHIGFANSIAVSTLVMRALRRAGVDSGRTGAHLFRHYLPFRTMSGD